MNTLRAVAAAGSIIMVYAFSPFALADGDPVAGDTLYQAHCASCHGDPSINRYHVLSGSNPKNISDWIAAGPAMMRVADLQTLTPANLTDIAAYLQAVKSGGAASPNYQGLWWKADESGWGVNFAHSGDLVFATWYTYDAAGNAYWLSMLGTRTSATSNAYSGDINVDVGPPFNNFVGSGSPGKVGTGTVTFTDANTGTFAYQLSAGGAANIDQSKPITRFSLGGAQPTCSYSTTPNLAGATNYQDLWWVPTESGWGVNFAHQGNLLFATWYTYDTKVAGNNAPLWLSALLAQGAGGVFIGPITRTSGPRFDNYEASDVVQPIPTVGTATVTFTDGNHASFHYITNGSGGLPVADQTKSITRFLFSANGATTCQ